MKLSKGQRKQRIKYRIRKIVEGTSTRPRLSVFRSNTGIYVQAIDDLAGITLASAGSRDASLLAQRTEKSKSEMSVLVGQLVATRLIEKGISEVVFDRGGNLYHGRVKCLAEGAREGGLKF